MRSSVWALLLLSLVSTSLAVDASEREALVDFYNACGGRWWVHQHNWLKGDPCMQQWYGVGCNGTNNTHVTIFDPIPRLSFNFIDCKLPPSIGNLTFLEHLYLRLLLLLFVCFWLLVLCLHNTSAQQQRCATLPHPRRAPRHVAQSQATALHVLLARKLAGPNSSLDSRAPCVAGIVLAAQLVFWPPARLERRGVIGAHMD
jgi:hypothetical protein